LGSQAITCDVLRAADTQAALNKTIEQFGRLACAFNNTSVEQEKTPIDAVEEAERARMVNTDLRGIFTVSQVYLGDERRPNGRGGVSASKKDCATWRGGR